MDIMFDTPSNEEIGRVIITEAAARREAAPVIEPREVLPLPEEEEPVTLRKLDDDNPLVG